MDNENSAANQPDESSNGSPDINSKEKLVNPPETGQPEPNNELGEVKRELTGYEKSTLRWTRVVVGINVITCLFIGLQFYEMQVAAVNQVAQLRPWIGIEGPLDELKPMQWGWTFTTKIKNYGSTPAFGVDVSFQMLYGLGVELEGKWPDACTFDSKRPLVTVFPQSYLPHLPERWEAGASVPRQLGGADSWIVGCIRYKDGAGRLHYTKMLYMGHMEYPDTQKFFNLVDVYAD
jgi:hypothetical protein